MKNFKKILLAIIATVMIASPFTISGVKAEEKVKVYIFEAGGCPYCEAELEYLQSLDSYNVKFEVIRKELYIDHVDWEQGADYNLGVKVANAFLDAGFKDASYQGTPFVVISDLYAASAYDTNLESYINQAYEEGDKDVVGCFEKGGDNCLPEKPSDGSETITTVVLIAIFVGIIAMVVVSRKNSSNDESVDDERSYDDDRKETVEDKKEDTKKKPENKNSKPQKSSNKKAKK